MTGNLTVRETLEAIEREYLSENASLSADTKGRARFEEKCDVRTDFQRDRDRILHSKSFRRLMHKTQVLFAPVSEHYRTRLTHTLEVSQIARTIAKALRLNEDLTEAIALGHDLGHTPFGHAGEAVLSDICPYGFYHNEQSLRVVDALENDGAGLNLTWEVRDGILNHRTRCTPSTSEGKIVRLADKIAYLTHDIDDAVRANILTMDMIPDDLTDYLGHTTSEITSTLVKSVIENSLGGTVKLGCDDAAVMYDLKGFMSATVYYADDLKDNDRVKRLIGFLYDYYMTNPDVMPEMYRKIAGEMTTERAVLDYISGMSDRYCIQKGQELMMPRSWSV